MTVIEVCTCQRRQDWVTGRRSPRNPNCGVHGEGAEPDDVTPAIPGLSVVMESTEASLMHLLQEHRRGCQLCWWDEVDYRSCSAGLLLRDAWVRSFELLTRPSLWAVVEVLRPISMGAAP